MPPIEMRDMPLSAPLAPSGAAVYEECPLPPQDLPSEDGEPLESNWHRVQMTLLIDMIEGYRQGRTDFFAGGNMFVHFNEERARNRDFRGPDFFLVNGVSHRQNRLYWAIWEEEGRYPDLIVELMSPTTRDNDLTTKFEVYEKIFTTREYVAYDPEKRQIHAWRKSGREFQPIVADDQGRYFLEEAGLWLGTWQGKIQDVDETTWIRFFDEFGNVVPAARETAAAEKARADAAIADADAEKARADAERVRADAAIADADAEKVRADAAIADADAEKARADAERVRADAAIADADAEKARASELAAEVARLKAQLGNRS